MAITFDKLRIEGIAGIECILDFHMNHGYGEHGRAWFKAELSEAFLWKHMMDTLEGRKLVVSADGLCLFHGCIEQCEYEHQSGYSTAAISVISDTAGLDKLPKSRSFQNTGMTYQEAAEEVIKDTEGAAVLYSSLDKKIEQPLIQYEETDWEFLMRLASHFKTSLLADIVRGKPILNFGFLQNGKSEIYNGSNYKVGIDKKYYEIGGEPGGFHQKDFLYYEITTEDNHDIGDGIELMGNPLVICSKEAALINDVLQFTYRLSKENYIGVRKRFNSKLSGAVIEGTVLAADKEWIRLHLDIDREQDEGTAYDFPWTPEMGNLFYCMPQIGTKASLYLGSSDEQEDARAIHSARKNGGSYEELINPENRYFTSEHGKRLQLLPSAIGFLGDDISHALKVTAEDETGISVRSPKSCVMTAKGSFVLNAGQIRMFAVKQVTAVKSNKSGESVFNICKQFDAIAKEGGLKGIDRKKYPPLNKTDRKKKLNEKKHSSILVKAAFSSIPTGIGGSSVAETALRGIPTGIEREK